MLAAVRSAAVLGVHAYEVMVEVDATRGLPSWTIVGLAANAIKEARERVSAALGNSGFELPPRRYTINLAPADIRKDGTAFDLPIALAVLAATGQVNPEPLRRVIALGELGLDGALRPVRGVLPVAMRAARELPARPLVVPPANAREARLVEGLDLWTPPTLRDLVRCLRAGVPCEVAVPEVLDDAPPSHADLADVAGQETAKRALEVAAAGGHALLLVGPPGAGKTMLARRLPSILPPLADPEALEVLAVHSVAGLIASSSLRDVLRPFRAPHHSLSVAALIGGGSTPRPGEVSLAHHGVLFLDELQEMPRARLDALRQPMEDGKVVISRAQQSVEFPAQFALIGAMNPCPCGFAGDARRACACSAADVEKHRARVSGPLADRIDMTVHVPAVALQDLPSQPAGAGSAEVRARVVCARERQRQRFATQRGVRCNAQASGRWLDVHTPIEPAARTFLVQAAERAGYSARGYHRVLRVARTIADLESADGLTRAHVAEAIFFRAPARVPPPAERA
ncbi:MAG: YifB family Mg chelatase-like AAA ATPase [Gemmatimonadaceae bacterium]|nr:YifB family Mg chelatase-like AAA ATPase [Gemmatimonadaceae bacterium]